MGSVKDLDVLQKPTESTAGIGNFTFSDRYSVFDWGEMPDHIANKGKALCLIGAYFFEKIEAMGIPTHYTGLVQNGSAKRIQDVTAPVNTMQVGLLQVLKPTLRDGVYDYSMYQKDNNNYLVPLEVIYRNSLPKGSSVFKRLKDGSLRLDDIGLETAPVPGHELERPILDVSTKLETTDRYMTWVEAAEISGIGFDRLKTIQDTTLQVDDIITREVQKINLLHEDGKLEYGVNEKGQVVVVDVFGTPDECRFTFEGIPVSKEAARRFYRKTDWFEDVEKAKKEDRMGWKQRVSPPPNLPGRLSILISELYMSFCNQLTERDWFDAPPLKGIMHEIRGFID